MDFENIFKPYTMNRENKRKTFEKGYYKTLRKTQLQPGGGRRQPHEAHEHCHEAAL